MGKLIRKLKFVTRDLKRDLHVYQLALKDPRTPKLAKVLLGLAVGYALLPIDIIPDFIPVLGHIDDLIVIPALIRIALRIIPDEVIDDCRLRIAASEGRLAFRSSARPKPAARGRRSGAKSASARRRRR